MESVYSGVADECKPGVGDAEVADAEWADAGVADAEVADAEADVEVGRGRNR